MALIIMLLDMININGTRYLRQFIESCHIIRKITIIYNSPKITFEMTVIYRVKPYKSCEKTDVSFGKILADRSEEHTSELQSLMRISYAVFCLKKKKKKMSIIETHYIEIHNTETTI